MRQYSVVNLVVHVFCVEHWHAVSASPRNLPTRWVVKPMRRSSPVNAWTKTIMLSTVQPVPPLILMMCFSLAVAPRRAILMNTIHC